MSRASRGGWRAWWLVGLVMVACACRHRRPEPLVATEPAPNWDHVPKLKHWAARAPIEHPVAPAPAPRIVDEGTRPLAFDPRPPFDPAPLIPDPTAEALAWPLGHNAHPELSPQFEIAAAIAEPGVHWTQLCRLGAHLRTSPRLRDELRYLRGWCAIAKHDTGAALEHFHAVRRSRVPGLAAAIVVDTANALVNHGDAPRATALLRRFPVEAQVLDSLAATYVELGRLEDGFEINEHALSHDDEADLGATCRRRTRRAAMRPDSMRAQLVANAPILGLRGRTNATCARLEATLDCWLRPALGCGAYFQLTGVAPGYAAVMRAYHAWSTVEDTTDWMELARTTATAGAPPIALTYAVAALDNAAIARGCIPLHSVLVEMARPVYVMVEANSADAAARVKARLAAFERRLHLHCRR